MTKTIKKLTALLFSATVLILLGGCSSTEIIDSPQEPAKKGKTITLSLSAPENASTRADADHKLRYVAKLIEGSLDNSRNEIDRKENIVSEGKTTITFSVVEGLYTIIIFADYIPADAISSNSDGNNDYYYDIHNTTEPQNISIKKHEVNNENMDCFGAIIEVDKTADKVEETITLARLVSKVRFVSTTPLPEGESLNNISYSKIPYYKTFNFTNKANIGINSLDKGYSSGTIETPALTANQDGEYELFYYYTPASTNKDLQAMEAYSFTLNIEDNEPKPIPIGQGKVPVIRNTVTTVKGEFLSPTEPTKGDIILNLSTPDEWGKFESTTWQAQ